MDEKMNCGKTVNVQEYSPLFEKNLNDYLTTVFMASGIKITDEAVNQFINYLKEIMSFQNKINLTSLKDPFKIVNKHFLDSLSCYHLIRLTISDFKEPIEMIDIGSGAGFPGIPIKITFSNEKMTLLEARKNKKHFLDKIVADLGLRNTVVIQNRAENFGRMQQYRERYHIVLSRAVAPLGILCEYCLPLCRIQGIMIAFKGSSYQKEIDLSYHALEKLGGTLESVHFVKIPQMNSIRSLLVIRKTDLTPENYPRRNGIPRKRPL